MEIKLLKPEELQANMFVTVVDWKSNKKPTAGHMSEGGSMFELLLGGGSSSGRRCFMGDVLRVLSVDLPYIQVFVVRSNYGKEAAYQLDVRDIDLKQLSPEYVAAVLHLMDKDRLKNLSRLADNLNASKLLMRSEQKLEGKKLQTLRTLIEESMECLVREAESTCK